MEDVEARVQARVAPDVARSPRALTVLYDPRCALCQRCRAWMQHRPATWRSAFVACSGAEARARYGDIPWLGDELVVVGDGGEVWVGPAAFLTCLWALSRLARVVLPAGGSGVRAAGAGILPLPLEPPRGIARLFEHDCEDGACRV